MPGTPPRILSIAGSDSSGGAGIQADIKTITRLSGYAMTAITAVTAQNTIGVQAVEMLPTDLIIAQIDSCLSDIGADAVKIGMLGSPEIADAVSDRLRRVRRTCRVRSGHGGDQRGRACGQSHHCGVRPADAAGNARHSEPARTRGTDRLADQYVASDRRSSANTCRTMWQCCSG